VAIWPHLTNAETTGQGRCIDEFIDGWATMLALNQNQDSINNHGWKLVVVRQIAEDALSF